jgi:hypothetical protein
MIQTEITYNDVARILEVSPRHARRIIHAHNLAPIRYGHRTVRFQINRILKLKIKLRKSAIVRGMHPFLAPANGHKHTNGRGR